MAEKQGVKETMDVLVAVNQLTVFLIERLKDGIAMDDLMAMYAKLTMDERFKSLLAEAYEGIKLVPAEVKDLDYQEVIQLISAQVNYLPLIIDEIKKP